MKTLASKENSIPPLLSELFCKKVEGGSAAQNKQAERRLFAPNISRQGGAAGGHNFANIPIFPAHSTSVIQPKLTVNEPGDKYEQEADAMADRVMRMSESVSSGVDEKLIQTQPLNITAIQRKCASCEDEEVKVQRKELDAGCFHTKPLMRKAEGGGAPLPSNTLSSMNRAFGSDFSTVRVHTGSRAVEMSQGIRAKAFTHGSDIYFNQGQYNHNSTEGKRLLAHELAHVVQQSGGIGDHIMRDVFVGPTTAMEILAEINRRLDTNNHARIDELVRSLTLMMSKEEAFSHGVPLVLRLFEVGLRAEAARVLEAVESAWILQFATNGKLEVASPLLADHPVSRLTNRADIEEAQGNHDSAIRLLKGAFYIAQMQLIKMTEDFDSRIKNGLADFGPEATNSLYFGMIRVLEYGRYSNLYQAIRRIATFYITRRRQARLAGNAQLASQYETLDGQLQSVLREDGTLFTGSELRGLTLMTSIPTDADPNPVMQGVNGELESIRPLPGAPRPDEIAKHPYYSIEMPMLLDTIRGQEQLTSEVFQFPEVVAAFPSHAIDWNNTGERVRLWIALYNGLQRQSGAASALPELLAHIQRYLQNYTFHTEYDIRDFGRSYLSSNFPTDLIDRVARDCGVYAVTVAYEVYRVANRASINVSFRFYTSLDHAILAILEPSQDRHYILSNDVVTGPTPGVTDGEIIDSVGRSFAAIGQTQFGVTPVMHNDAGDSSMGERRFSTQLWSQFREVGHTWGLRDRTLMNPDTQEPESMYDRHYRDLRTFSQRASIAAQRMETIEQRLSLAATRTDQLTLLQNEFVSLADAVIDEVWPLFMRLGECADIATTSRALAGRQREFVFNAGTTTHPLVHTARLLLTFKQRGGNLTRPHEFFICSLQNIPMFQRELQRSGLPLPTCPSSFVDEYRRVCRLITAS